MRFIDSMMIRINLLLLMTTAFLPFPTRILAEALRAPDGAAKTAVILYGATVLVIELVLRAAARYATSRPDLALATRSDPAIARPNLSGRWWLSATVVLYALAFCVALVDFLKLATVLYLVLGDPGRAAPGAPPAAPAPLRVRRATSHGTPSGDSPDGGRWLCVSALPLPRELDRRV